MPRSHQHLRRLFVAADLATGAQVGLSREQSHYLINVLRMAAGAELVLFNGRDGAWLARIADAGRKGATLEAVAQIAPQTPPADLVFAFAPIKVGRLDYVVQKATEMGAGRIQPFITRFTEMRRLNRERLEANIVEAAEQCEVLAVPPLGEPIEFSSWLDGWATGEPGRRLVFCDESAASTTPLPVLAGLGPGPLALLVGPEGGFAPEERERLLASPFATPISLGPRILRADTAAVAALAVLQASIGDWR